MWSFWICDTRTGVKQLRVEPAGGSCSRLLNAGGKGSHSFVLSEGSPLRDRVLTRPWSRTLVVCWHDVPVYAGLIVKRTYSHSRQTLTVDHEDIRSILARRFLFGEQGYWVNSVTRVTGSLAIANKSIRAAMGIIVATAMQSPYSVADLPIVLPSQTEAGSFTKTYENYHFVTPARALQELQDLSDGPDLDFEPRWSSAGRLEWLMRVGSPSVPALSGSVVDANMSAENGGLFDVVFSEDAQKQVTNVLAVGAGSEQDMLVNGAGSGDFSLPGLDIMEAYKDETYEPLLVKYAQSQIDTYKNPTEQWECSMLASGRPGLTSVKLGTVLRLFWHGDLWVPDGAVNMRVVSMSFDMSEKVVVDVQPWGA